MFQAERVEMGKEYATEVAAFSEKDLILGILWEGDLEIHSNVEFMKTHVFKERIVHGDSVAAKAIGLILNSEIFSGAGDFRINQAKYTFLSPVYINDQLSASFIVKQKEQQDREEKWALSLSFEVFKGVADKKRVSKGEIYLEAV